MSWPTVNTCRSPAWGPMTKAFHIFWRYQEVAMPKLAGLGPELWILFQVSTQTLLDQNQLVVYLQPATR